MNDTPTPAGPPLQGGKEPPLIILTQYVKDLSFENPNAPVIFGQTQKSPKITISVDTRVNSIQDRLAEVVLALRVEAQVAEKNAFLIELDYAGIANLTGDLPPEEAEEAYFIEAPTMLFPFARAIVGNLSRDGGFMPFLMAPIDFEQLYRQRKEQGQESAPAVEEGEDNPDTPDEES